MKYLEERMLTPPYDEGKIDDLEIELRSTLLGKIGKYSSIEGDDICEEVEVFLVECLNFCDSIINSSFEKSDVNYNIGCLNMVKKIPFLLLEDTFDVLPLSSIQNIFESYLKTNLARLSGKTFFSLGSKLCLIRMCNKILKKVIDSEFAGRVLAMLSVVLPLSERSAVNVSGKFNVENITTFEKEEEFLPQIPEESTKKGELVTTDYCFYKYFWGLQDYFCNPRRAIENSEEFGFSRFSLIVEKVLNAFEGHPLNKSISRSLQMSQTSFGSQNHKKYLTSSQLLRLQLRDPDLRLHFLTQLMIMLSHLQFLPDTQTKFCSDQKLSISKFQERIRFLMKSMREDGSQHYQLMAWLLSHREVLWKQWKESKCPSIEKSFSPVTNLSLQKTKNSSLTSFSKYDLPFSLSLLSTKKISPINTVDFLETYADALDPEKGIEEEYHPQKNALYCFRATRLMHQKYSGKCYPLIKKDGNLENAVREIWLLEKGIQLPPSTTEENEDDDATETEQEDTLTNSLKFESKLQENDEDHDCKKQPQPGTNIPSEEPIIDTKKTSIDTDKIKGVIDDDCKLNAKKRKAIDEETLNDEQTQISKEKKQVKVDSSTKEETSNISAEESSKPELNSSGIRKSTSKISKIVQKQKDSNNEPSLQNKSTPCITSKAKLYDKQNIKQECSAKESNITEESTITTTSQKNTVKKLIPKSDDQNKSVEPIVSYKKSRSKILQNTDVKPQKISNVRLEATVRDKKSRTKNTDVTLQPNIGKSQSSKKSSFSSSELENVSKVKTKEESPKIKINDEQSKIKGKDQPSSEEVDKESSDKISSFVQNLTDASKPSTFKQRSEAKQSNNIEDKPSKEVQKESSDKPSSFVRNSSAGSKHGIVKQRLEALRKESNSSASRSASNNGGNASSGSDAKINVQKKTEVRKKEFPKRAEKEEKHESNNYASRGTNSKEAGSSGAANSKGWTNNPTSANTRRSTSTSGGETWSGSSQGNWNNQRKRRFEENQNNNRNDNRRRNNDYHSDRDNKRRNWGGNRRRTHH